MRIDNEGVRFSDERAMSLDSLDKILQGSAHNNVAQESPQELHSNGYSAIPFKEMNNRIGILQIAQKSLQNIINNSNITLDDVLREINSAQFLGNGVFDASMIVRNESGEVLFDANRILNILPSDERDLYIFKKALKNEVDFIAQSLQGLQSANLAQETYDANNVSDYLTSNAMLFSKAHNTLGLIAKIDALLA